MHDRRMAKPKRKKRPAVINAELAALAAPLRDLRPVKKNVKLHPEESIASIVESLKAFGQQKPIVALKDGTIVAGNGTYEAARRLGWDKIAVVRFSSRRRWEAFAVADNRTAELSGWDYPELAATLKSLQESGEDLLAVGFSDEAIERIAASAEIDVNAEWQGMPAFEVEDQNSKRKLIVHFKSDADADAFVKKAGLNIVKGTRGTESAWWPDIPRTIHTDKVWKAKPAKKRPEKRA